MSLLFLIKKSIKFNLRSKFMLKKIKYIFKEICPPIVWKIIKNYIKKNETEYKYYGLNQLDKKLESFINFDNGYFVELGANDGINQSNTYYFEKYRGWSGILIEPVGQKYLECLNNRSDKNKIFCNACVSFDYQEKFVELIYSNLMTIAENLENQISNPKEHALKGIQYLDPNEKNYTFGSVAKTLNSILKISKAPKKIDFLSLDVEGSEMEVLKGVDHNEFRFNFICVETKDKEKLTNYLYKYNYILVEQLSLHDYLYKDAN